MAFLEGKGLFKSFGGLRVIYDISFDVGEGEIFGIIGPNGSGKTTLFNLITGFLKPDRGEIEFVGNNVTGQKPYALCKMGLTRTFQIVRPFVQLTALDNVVAGRTFGREPAQGMKKARQEALEVLEVMGLGNKRHIIAGQLTLLDRKRLEIARAFAARPRLLLLDEVFAGLNHVEVEEALKLLARLRELGITMMIVEHVLKVILGVSDRVMVISSGRKIFEGIPRDAVADERVCEAYLGDSAGV